MNAPKSDVNTQRVNAAVAVAVRRAVAEMPTVGNRRALELSIGRRLQGTYGAQLRVAADGDSSLSAAELCEAVVFPAEYPNDIPVASIYSGERDQARKSRPNAPSPADGWPDGKLKDVPGWGEGLDAAKAALAVPVPVAPPPVAEADPEYAAHMDTLRSARDRGVEEFQQGRRRRLEAARMEKM